MRPSTHDLIRGLAMLAVAGTFIWGAYRLFWSPTAGFPIQFTGELLKRDNATVISRQEIPGGGVRLVFAYPEGVLSHRGSLTVPDGELSRRQPGETLAIVYDPERPESWKLARTDWRAWLLGALVLLPAILGFAVGAHYLRRWREQAGRASRQNRSE